MSHSFLFPDRELLFVTAVIQRLNEETLSLLHTSHNAESSQLSSSTLSTSSQLCTDIFFTDDVTDTEMIAIEDYMFESDVCFQDKYKFVEQIAEEAANVKLCRMSYDSNVILNNEKQVMVLERCLELWCAITEYKIGEETSAHYAAVCDCVLWKIVCDRWSGATHYLSKLSKHTSVKNIDAELKEYICFVQSVFYLLCPQTIKLKKEYKPIHNKLHYKKLPCFHALYNMKESIEQIGESSKVNKLHKTRKEVECHAEMSEMEKCKSDNKYATSMQSETKSNNNINHRFLVLAFALAISLSLINFIDAAISEVTQQKRSLRKEIKLMSEVESLREAKERAVAMQTEWRKWTLQKSEMMLFVQQLLTSDAKQTVESLERAMNKNLNNNVHNRSLLHVQMWWSLHWCSLVCRKMLFISGDNSSDDDNNNKKFTECECVDNNKEKEKEFTELHKFVQATLNELDECPLKSIALLFILKCLEHNNDEQMQCTHKWILPTCLHADLRVKEKSNCKGNAKQENVCTNSEAMETNEEHNEEDKQRMSTATSAPNYELNMQTKLLVEQIKQYICQQAQESMPWHVVKTFLRLASAQHSQEQ